MNKDCGELNKNGCTLDYFEKNAYFHGKLITARDMTAEQRMHEGKLYTINRLVLGDGVVCGLKVEKLVVDENTDRLMATIRPGMAVDCCGRILVVKDTGGAITKEVKSAENGGGTYPDPLYLYIKYRECLKEAVPVPEAGDACKEKCCYNRILEVFDVVYKEGGPIEPSPLEVNFPSKAECEGDDNRKAAMLRIAQEYYEQHKSEACGECTEPMVFLGVYRRESEGWRIDEAETKKYLSVVYNNKMLYDVLAGHVTRFDNPHEVTAKQVGALMSVNEVGNKPGQDEENWVRNIDLVPDDSNTIAVTPESDKKHIKLGVKNDSITTAHIKNNTVRWKDLNKKDVRDRMVRKIKGVPPKPASGNIDLLQENAIVITSNNANNTITIGENHSQKKNNPHGVTAKHTGALVSVNKVKNPGGNIDLIEGKNIKIDPNNAAKNIVISAPISVDGVEPDAAGNIDLESSDGSVLITPKPAQHKIDFRVKGMSRELLWPIYRYLMDKSLKYKLKAFSTVSERFESKIAKKILEMIETALSDRVYTSPENYLEIMRNTLQLEGRLIQEIRMRATPESVERYSMSLTELKEVLELDDVALVAIAQDEVCEMAEWLEIAKPVRVPFLIGHPMEMATEVLRQAGLRLGRVTRQRSILEPETVLFQEPGFGVKVSAGTRVNLVIAAQ